MKDLVGDLHSHYFLSLFVFKVDNEFESVATQLLKRTQAMLNKYRCLLLDDAMVKFCYQAYLFFKTLQGTTSNSERKTSELHFPSIV